MFEFKAETFTIDFLFFFFSSLFLDRLKKVFFSFSFTFAVRVYHQYWNNFIRHVGKFFVENDMLI